MIRRPPRSTLSSSSAASDVYKRQVFALMFKILPDAKIKWRHVWIGSLVTAFLFDIGKFGLGLYFGKANPGTGYGAGFTYAYANMNSGKVAPSEIAKTALPC